MHVACQLLTVSARTVYETLTFTTTPTVIQPVTYTDEIPETVSTTGTTVRSLQPLITKELESDRYLDHPNYLGNHRQDYARRHNHIHLHSYLL